MPIKLYIYAAIAAVVLGYIGYLNYQLMSKDKDIAQLQTNIVQYKANVKTLKDANASLKTDNKAYQKAASKYADMVSVAHTQTAQSNMELQTMRQKLASHNLQKLRDSKHAEAVLKIINKSIRKQQKEYIHVID